MLFSEFGRSRLHLSIRPKAREPLHVVSPEPGELSLGIVAMSLRAKRHGLLAGDFTAQFLDGLRISKRSERAAIIAIFLHQSSALLDETAVKHLRGASVDAVIQRSTRRIESNAKNGVACKRFARVLTPVRGNGTAGNERDLDGADDLGKVVGVDGTRRRRIETRENAMQPRRMLLRANSKLRTQSFVALRPRRQPFEQSAQIEASATGNDRQFATLRDSRDGLASKTRIVSRCAWLVRRKDVQQMMRHERAFFARRFRGADLHAAVDRDRVAGDNLSRKAGREREGERGLAAGRGAGDNKQWRIVLHGPHQYRSHSCQSQADCA